ncbi:MAG: hypothetical protein V8R80_07020 [Eubacterium sp.]
MRKKTVILTAILFVILLFVPSQAYAAELSEEQFSCSTAGYGISGKFGGGIHAGTEIDRG